MSKLVLIKNAFANFCRGGSSALVLLLLPPFLTKVLTKDAYGTWLLILQISNYAYQLDFGVQTAVSRFVAHHHEIGNIKQRNSIVSTAFFIQTCAALLAIIGVSILAWQLPFLFKDMPVELHQDARMALMYVGYSIAVSLPFSIFGAVFIGLQRYDVPAWIAGTAKLLGGVFVVLIANASHSIVMMAIVTAIVNLCSCLWQFVAYKKMMSHVSVSSKLVSKSTAKEIVSYCSSLVVANLGMLLVNGVDAVVIGYYDYKSLVYYSIAATLVTFIIGVQHSIFFTILPYASAISARGDREGLGKLLVSATRYGAIGLFLTSLPLIASAKWLINIWLGETYAAQMVLLLQLLVVANFIRQLGLPYAIISTGVGEQRLLILSQLIEGCVNFVASVILVKNIGSIGVALGTIIGSFFSIGLHFFYNLPRSQAIVVEDKVLLVKECLRPFIAIVPIIIFLLLTIDSSTIPSGLDLIWLFCAIGASVAALYVFAVDRSEKKELKLLIAAKLQKK